MLRVLMEKNLEIRTLKAQVSKLEQQVSDAGWDADNYRLDLESRNREDWR